MQLLEGNSLTGTRLITIYELEKYYPYLLDLRKQRSFAEYCWTLTPHLIEYIFDIYGERYNTYLDSDLYFYANPDVLNSKMIQSNCDTLITDHRFPLGKNKKKQEKSHGKYCVQFNTFTNNNSSRRLLERWKNNVILDCEYNKIKKKAGDQKYLEEFPILSKSVYIPDDIGVGVGPWNISQYSLVSKKGNEIIIKDGSKRSKLFFYHFQNINFISEHIVNIGAGRCERNLKNAIYIDYLQELLKIREKLKHAHVIIKPRSLSRNKLLALAQKHLKRFKIRDFDFTDIIFLSY
jgi:hypothetical protein